MITAGVVFVKIIHLNIRPNYEKCMFFLVYFIMSYNPFHKVYFLRKILLIYKRFAYIYFEKYY